MANHIIHAGDLLARHFDEFVESDPEQRREQ
jgi:hypothetical protein